jgi:hypothetical protein
VLDQRDLGRSPTGRPKEATLVRHHVPLEVVWPHDLRARPCVLEHHRVTGARVHDRLHVPARAIGHAIEQSLRELRVEHEVLEELRHPPDLGRHQEGRDDHPHDEQVVARALPKSRDGLKDEGHPPAPRGIGVMQPRQVPSVLKRSLHHPRVEVGGPLQATSERLSLNGQTTPRDHAGIVSEQLRRDHLRLRDPIRVPVHRRHPRAHATQNMPRSTEELVRDGRPVCGLTVESTAHAFPRMHRQPS